MRYLFIVVFFWPKIEFSRVSKIPWGERGLDFFWFELFFYFKITFNTQKYDASVNTRFFFTRFWPEI